MFRLALIFALATVSHLAMAAEPGQTPSSSPPASSPPSSGAADRITAGIIVRELKAMNYT